MLPVPVVLLVLLLLVVVVLLLLLLLQNLACHFPPPIHNYGTYSNVINLITSWLTLNYKLVHIQSVDFIFVAVFLASDTFQRYKTNILSGKILLWKV